MALSLIVGPPNAGRAGAIRRRFADALESDPVLVVPTVDDVDRFERELCEGGEAVIGGSVCTFPWLFADVARATGAEQLPRLTSAQRLWLVRSAARSADLSILSASAGSAGFAPAAERLIGELQAAGIDPATLEAAAVEAGADGAYEAELAAVFRGYESFRDRLGRADAHRVAAAATAALRSNPDAWGRRPVFLYGFDDLTVEQQELVRALSDAGEVTIAVAYEDRAALQARARLLGVLEDDLGANVVESLEPTRAHTASETLFHLERHLFGPALPLGKTDGGLVFCVAAGERAEAEQIGGEVARLLAAGVPADEVAVVVRAPERHGTLYEKVLSGLGIPVAVDARIPFSATATGRALISVLRAALGEGEARDVLTLLRAPGRVRPEGVDWLERRIYRKGLHTASQALAAWNEDAGWEPDEVRELREAGPGELAGKVAALARRIAERPHRRAAPRPGPASRIELRAASEAGRALAEVGELEPGGLGAAAVIALLEDLTVPLWRGPAEGRVRVLSPYRVRARRVRHLFVASLQEGEFPSHDPGDPLLGDERRAALGLPPRRDPEHEERYLFHACVSRPSERLYLSWRDSDDDGQALAPSPFLDDVRDLLPATEDGEAVPVRRRGLDRVTFEPGEAPTPDELARALAALGAGPAPEAMLDELGVPTPIADRLRERLRAAARTLDGLPGPLTQRAVLAELEGRKLYGASTLEEYAVCSYRWFVGHELRPQSIEPDPEPLAQGGIVHKVLERLYREPPGRESLPRPGELDAWVARARELLDEVAAERGFPTDALGRVGRRRMLVLVERFLAREAESETPLRPDRELIEASFGEGEHDDRPPLDMGGFALHGKIDRVDVDPGRRSGLVRDYKLGRAATPAAKLVAEGKLQPQLYMHALRRQWGIEPVGGVYVPLGATDSPRPRGLLRKEECGELLDADGFVRTDFLEDDEFAEALTEAGTRASGIVARMRAGVIQRDPPDDRCPTYCRFQPICRRERAVVPEPTASEEPEE